MEPFLMVWNQQKEGILNFECDDVMHQQILQEVLVKESNIGIIAKEDALYERLRVQDYLKLFTSLTRNNALYEKAVDAMHLHDLLYVRIQKLTFSQKRRVSFAREIILDHFCLVIQEPLLNLDDDSFSMILSWIEQLPFMHKNIITTSVSFKHLCMLPGDRYYITQKECILVENIQDTIDMPEQTFEKISAKLGDKILLFNPNEIDYIESIDSKSYLSVRRGSFLCPLTMDELEQKLKRFGFYRSHRCYLVNMQKVKEVIRWTRNSYSLKLEGIEDMKIPLSKGRVDDMKDLCRF